MNDVIGRGRRRCLMRLNQSPPLQRAYRVLYRAFRQPGIERDLVQAGDDSPADVPLPTRPPVLRAGPQVQEDDECRWLLVVTNEIGHQAVDDVAIEGEAHSNYDYSGNRKGFTWRVDARRVGPPQMEAAA